MKPVKWGTDFDLKPSAKLIITGNNRPTLWNVDRAIRRRFHMVTCRKGGA